VGEDTSSHPRGVILILVTAGLDPAVHAEVTNKDAAANLTSGTSAWIAGSSPAMTQKGILAARFLFASELCQATARKLPQIK
jgi:hypothetical protein